MAVLTGEGRVSILYGVQAGPMAPHRSVYLARPDAVGRHPGIAIAHDGYEPTPQIRDLARRLARFGYAAAVPPGTDRELRGVVAAFSGAWADWSDPGRTAVLGVGRGAHGAAGVSGVAATILLAPDLTDLEVTGAGHLLVITGSADAATARSRIGSGTWVTYPGLADGFWDDHSADFSADAARDAFARIIDCLDRALSN